MAEDIDTEDSNGAGISSEEEDSSVTTNQEATIQSDANVDLRSLNNTSGKRRRFESGSVFLYVRICDLVRWNVWALHHVLGFEHTPKTKRPAYI